MTYKTVRPASVDHVKNTDIRHRLHAQRITYGHYAISEAWM